MKAIEARLPSSGVGAIVGADSKDVDFVQRARDGGNKTSIRLATSNGPPTLETSIAGLKSCFPHVPTGVDCEDIHEVWSA